MRIPEKSLKAADRLRKEIESGVYPAGSRLPVEKAMAKEFGIAYETMRRAISILVQEKLLESHTSKGTFVLGGRRENRELYFLIPCPDYFEKSGQSTYRLTSGLLSGCLEESLYSNFSLITLPFSQTNSQKDIDFNSLQRIPNGARVIFYGAWFRPVFSYLRGKKARVLLIHDIWPTPEIQHSILGNSWATCYLNKYEHYMKAIEYLFHECGCRKICILLPCLENKECSYGLFAADVEEKYHEKCQIICKNMNSFPSGDFFREIRESFRESLFDGLFLAAPEFLPINYAKSLNANLGLPESVKIVTDRVYSFNAVLNPPVPACRFDYKEAGRISAHFLFHETYRPVILNVKSEDIILTNRKG